MQPEGFIGWIERYVGIVENDPEKQWEQLKITAPHILAIDIEKGRDFMAALRKWQRAD